MNDDYAEARAAQRERVINHIRVADVALVGGDMASAQANALLAIARLLYLRETETPTAVTTFNGEIPDEQALAINKKLAGLYRRGVQRP